MNSSQLKISSACLSCALLLPGYGAEEQTVEQPKDFAMTASEPRKNIGNEDAPEIIYVPGWLRSGPHEDLLAILRKCFPGASARQFLWDNVHGWKRSLENADHAATRLELELAALPRERRERTILVGHSLGGRLCVRTLARLAGRGFHVRQAILLAAAIPDDDPDIAKSQHGTAEPILNFCNPDDVTLKYGYGTFGEGARPALGASGALQKQAHFFNIAVSEDITGRVQLSERKSPANLEFIKRLANHHARFYLGFLKEQLESDFAGTPRLLVPQDRTNLEMPVADRRVFWSELDSCCGWSLQCHRLTGLCRILDADKRCRAWGGRSRMRESFERIREQLRQK